MKTNRRTLLKSMGLASMGLAGLGSFQGNWLSRAKAASSKCRLVVITSPNGFVDNRRQGLVMRSASDFTLNDELRAFERVRSKFSYIENLHCPFNRDLHGSHVCTLSMMPPGPPEWTGFASESNSIGRTFDHAIADSLSMGDAFPVLGVGFRDAASGQDLAKSISLSAPDTPIAIATGAADFYTRYFDRALAAPSSGVSKSVASDYRLLQSLEADVEAFTRTLAAANSRLSNDGQLASFQKAIKDLERSIAAQTNAASACGEVVGGQTIAAGKELGPEAVNDAFRAVAQGLACGLSHVAHISLTAFGAPHQTYPWLDPSYYAAELTHHHCSPDHAGTDATANRCNKDITQWHFDQVVKFYEMLADYPDGDGTLQDSTVVLWLNIGGMTHHSGGENHAAIVLGNARGALRGERFLRLERGRRSLSDLYVTLAQAMEVPMTSFGDPAHNRGIFGELLT